MVSWQICKKDFEWDGSWRDIYVLSPAKGDWRLLSAKLLANYKFSFQVDGNDHPFPQTIDEVFALRKKAAPILSLEVGPANLACHFFTADEIEFDFDPRQITSQSDLNSLLDFLRLVANTVKKPVLLTLENLPTNPILTYNPQTDEFEYHPA